MSDRIRLETDKLEEKISRLENIRAALENDAKISALPFGCGMPEDECTGCAADSLRRMNQELEACAKKFSVLVAATVQYLQTVKATFEEADAAMGG